MTNQTEIKWIHIDKLKLWDANPRDNNDAIKPVADSIKNHGFNSPIIAGRDGTIYAGNTRYKAALALDLEKVPVVYVDFESEAHAAAFALADNKTAEAAQWDFPMMADILQEIDTGGLDVSALTGFDSKELEQIASYAMPEPVQDEVPEPPKNPITKLGDVIELGEHRLMCGDSTKVDDVAKLMGGNKADLCFTSPPYGQQRDYTEESDVSDWDALMNGVFTQLPMQDDGQVLVNLGLIHRNGEWMPYWEGWIDWMREQGWRRFGWYVWDQGAGLMGDWNGRLAPSFEFIFHFNKESIRPTKHVPTKESSRVKKKEGAPAQRGKDGKVKRMSSLDKTGQDRKIPDSVIRISRNATIDMARNNHPATFPIQFPVEMMKAWAGLVYEPFSGSGSTMMAAEQLGRTCYGMEISPAYVDVCVERWETLTGKTATRPPTATH